MIIEKSILVRAESRTHHNNFSTWLEEEKTVGGALTSEKGGSQNAAVNIVIGFGSWRIEINHQGRRKTLSRKRFGFFTRKLHADAVALLAFIGLMTFGVLAIQAEAIAEHVHIVKGAVIVERSPDVADMDSGQSLDAGPTLSSVAIRVTQDGVDPDNWGIMDVYRGGTTREQGPDPVRLRAQGMMSRGARVTACTLQK
ncbi:hypothetical protein HY629_00055 [Candidatus Uhrbacteria bacterium]|nr:hypothetical protein [Candidatus Uhrbacteria bacterium]